MSSINRHHTIVVQMQGDVITGAMLEKDWYSYEWCSGFQFRHIIETKVGTFHIVGQSSQLSLSRAAVLVSNVLRGKIATIDLREMSMKHYSREEKKGQRK